MTIIAYHFSGTHLRDGRPLPKVGEWLIHDGPVKMCESGLHASRDPFDAFKYAPGQIIHRVECDDIVAEDSDKLVCRKRRIIASGDAIEMLRYFSRMQALSVVHLWDAPDVVLDYLMTGDETARAAAWDAAQAAAQDAAWDDARNAAWAAARGAAAWDAAQAAARAAAWDAAQAAAWAAAQAAARNAAWAAAWDAARGAAAWDAAQAAARDAARAAAWYAAWAAVRLEFNQLVREGFDD